MTVAVPTPSWAVLVWAVVTKDLEESYRRDLHEAEVALGAIGSDIKVQIYKTGPGLPVTSRLPSTETVSGSGGGLRDALDGLPEWDTAARRALVLWGHGSQTAPSGERADWLVPPAVDVVSAFTPTGAGDPKLPDLIGYDACRMASTATVLRLAEAFPNACFIGSMVPEPASGWPYFELLGILGRPWQTAAISSAIVEAYAASVGVPSWCMVALRLGALRPATGTTLRTALTQLFETEPRTAEAFYTAAQHTDLDDDSDLADLGTLMTRLGRTEADTVRTVLNEAIIAHRAAGGLSTRDGVSVLIGVPRPRDKVPGTWTEYFPDLYPLVMSST